MMTVKEDDTLVTINNNDQNTNEEKKECSSSSSSSSGGVIGLYDAKTRALHKSVNEFFVSKVWKDITGGSGYLRAGDLEDDDDSSEEEEDLNEDAREEKKKEKKKKKDAALESPYRKNPCLRTSFTTKSGDILTYDALTYGEITIPGARQLFRCMGIDGAPADKEEEEENIVFLDLGSGVGRLVMQTYMECPRVQCSMGIEISEIRHKAAISAWEKLQNQAKQIRSTHFQTDGQEEEQEQNTPTTTEEEDKGKVELILADFLQADLSSVTHIYISSLCFPDALMYKIAEKIQNDQLSPKNLQCIATLKQFPMEFEKRGIVDRINYELVYKTFGLFRRVVEIDMSWTQNRPGGCKVFLYTKQQHPITRKDILKR